jgi:hypothetical protein
MYEKRIASIEVSENEKWSIEVIGGDGMRRFELDLLSIDPRFLDQLRAAGGQPVMYKKSED